ncbi:MAG: hypothetical protein LBG61_02785 [Burkholderiales bacterium]|jgi:DNA-binding transcriptional regulator YiaG|nr:hypothetical protein [Burkholderiales bacterium]
MSLSVEQSNLKRLRQELGLNQSQFWTPLGVTQSGGSRYEQADRVVPKPILLLLTIAYGSQKESDALIDALRERKN